MKSLDRRIVFGMYWIRVVLNCVYWMCSMECRYNQKARNWNNKHDRDSMLLEQAKRLHDAQGFVVWWGEWWWLWGCGLSFVKSSSPRIYCNNYVRIQEQAMQPVQPPYCGPIYTLVYFREQQQTKLLHVNMACNAGLLRQVLNNWNVPLAVYEI